VHWGLLSKPELRLLMAGLASWEQRSRGAQKARIRRKRLDAVSFYGRKFGRLSDDRMWVAPRLEEGVRGQHLRPHNPKRENLRGVLWHET
jgi:hypothetical protein